MSSSARKLPIEGAYLLSSTAFSDQRGLFSNIFRSQDETFIKSWGCLPISQVNLSRTDVIGTIRGLHLQVAPHGDAKIVRCLRGSVWDVAVDLRPHSSTYGVWHAVELSSNSSHSYFIPEGCAHGFQVLEPMSEILYLHSGTYLPEAESGVRFDDPQLAISWPLPPVGLSERDLSLPLL